MIVNVERNRLILILYIEEIEFGRDFFYALVFIYFEWSFFLLHHNFVYSYFYTCEYIGFKILNSIIELNSLCFQKKNLLLKDKCY